MMVHFTDRNTDRQTDRWMAGLPFPGPLLFRAIHLSDTERIDRLPAARPGPARLLILTD